MGIELNADWLIMDERIGRETARHMNVKVTGLLGCLLAAKHKNIVQKIAPVLLQLRDLAGFRISQELHKRILSIAAE